MRKQGTQFTERDTEILEYYIEHPDYTYEQVGQHFDLSRQAVNAHLNKPGCKDYIQKLNRQRIELASSRALRRVITIMETAESDQTSLNAAKEILDRAHIGLEKEETANQVINGDLPIIVNDLKDIKNDSQSK